jgi:hypothetical protein
MTQLAKYYNTMDEIGIKHVRNPSVVPTATLRLFRVPKLMATLRELVGNVWIVEMPKLPDDDVKVTAELGGLESIWVGARATPAIPELVKLGTDVGGVSMMAFERSLIQMNHIK